MSVADLVGQIRSQQAGIASPQAMAAGVSAEAGAATELRYVVETEHPVDPETIARQVSAIYGFAVAAEPAFPGTDDPDLARLTLLRIPGPAESDLRASPFDLAYDLMDRLGYERVEPDLDAEIFPAEPDREPAALALMSGFDVLGCWVNGASPSDKGWAPRMLRAPQAWDFSTSEGRPAHGAGVVIAQIDTGFTAHSELQGAIDPAQGRDFIDNDLDPTDPLRKVLPIDNPGHGTATASVAVSRGTITSGGTGGPGEVTGTAPAATLVPIRAIRSVSRLNQLNVARAIDYAADKGLPIVTMSLGGLPSIALWLSLRSAAKRNVLIMAAAGNCVREVVFPARYENCIAVAGVNAARKPWKGSCRGSAVDVSAPAELIWRARAKLVNDTPVFDADGTGEGTSYAVALTAGVAALWLAHHGRQNLIGDLAGGETLLDRFRALLKQSAHRPSNWDSANFGAGIVDAEALLTSGMRPEAVLTPMAAAGIRGDSYADLVDDIVDDPSSRAVLATGAAPATGLSRAEKEKFGLEIIWHVYRARLAATRGVSMTAMAGAAATAPPAVSDQLSGILARPGTEALRRLMVP